MKKDINRSLKSGKKLKTKFKRNLIYDAPLSQKFAAAMAKEGIFVTGFYYPVVPKGQARIRVQLSAAHTRPQLDKAIAAFIKVGRELGVLKK